MVIVAIPPPYRGPTRGEAEVEVGADTVSGCIDAVEAKYPGLKELVVDRGGRPHHFVRLFVNGHPLLGDAVLDHPVGPGDRLEILSAIAGG